MSTPRIRLARAADVDAAAELWLRFQREHNGSYVRQVRLTRANRQRVAEHFAKLQQVRQLWVLATADGLAGFAAVSPNTTRLELYFASAAVTDLYVAPAWRGRGLGRKLLARVVADVRRRGLHAVTISVLAGNPARGLYRAAGFQPMSETLILPLDPDMVRTGPGYVGD